MAMYVTLNGIVQLGKERQFLPPEANTDFERACVFLYEWTQIEVGRLDWATRDPNWIVEALIQLQQSKADHLFAWLNVGKRPPA